MARRQWSRTPKYILRKDCIEYMTREWKISTFVEFGSGTGDMTSMFLDRGFSGVCYDLGEKNRAILRENLSRYGWQAEVIDSLSELEGRMFDYLLAFEVIEHIVNDIETLALWSEYLRPGGRIIVSVPAHMKKYGASDRSVGHVRRYEKEDLCLLLNKAGYSNITIMNYGYPLGNLTRLASEVLRGSEREKASLSDVEKSIRSGIESSSMVNRLSFLFDERILLPFILIQRLFFGRDLGDGYVACAEKQ